MPEVTKVQSFIKAQGLSKQAGLTDNKALATQLAGTPLSSATLPRQSVTGPVAGLPGRPKSKKSTLTGAAWPPTYVRRRSGQQPLTQNNDTTHAHTCGVTFFFRTFILPLCCQTNLSQPSTYNQSIPKRTQFVSASETASVPSFSISRQSTSSPKHVLHLRRQPICPNGRHRQRCFYHGLSQSQ